MFRPVLHANRVPFKERCPYAGLWEVPVPRHAVNRVLPELRNYMRPVGFNAKGVAMAVTVIKSKCPQNHGCPALKVCPSGALTQEGFNAPVINSAKCIDCGLCTEVCPMGALTLDEQ